MAHKNLQQDLEAPGMERLQCQSFDAHQEEPGERITNPVQLAGEKHASDQIQPFGDQVAGKIQAGDPAAGVPASGYHQVGMPLRCRSEQQGDHLGRMLQVAVHDAGVLRTRC